MKPHLDDLKRELAQRAFDFLQHRRQAQEAAEQKRDKRRQEEAEKRRQLNQEEAERDIKRLRDSVSGPDTPDAVQLWMEVMGQRPTDDIQEIYATRSKGWVTNYLSFTYKNEEVFTATLLRTHWTKAIELLSEEFDDANIDPKLPQWVNYWPFQPSPAARKGGVPTSKPFYKDCFYYYLDTPNRRFFLSTGMTHKEFSDFWDGELERMGFKKSQ